MPIEYRIDHDRRLVLARGSGHFTAEDMFGYQNEVWSRPEVAGYSELIDMRPVEKIVHPSPQRIKDLAAVSAQMDAPLGNSKFAIVASDHLAFGLGRMYQAFREMDERSTKKVATFRTMEEALHWLAEGETGSEANR